MWKAVFASVGAAVGPFVGSLTGRFLMVPPTVSRPPVYWLGLPPVYYFAVPIGGALFAFLGFWLGSTLDRRSGRRESTQKRKAAFTAFGAAVGPLIGFHAVAQPCVLHTRLSGHGNEWRGLGALVAGALVGVPVGGVLFCLLGLYLGAALDERSGRRHSQTEGSRSA